MRMPASGKDLLRHLLTLEGLAALALVVCLAWFCWPTLTVLWDRWGSDPQYSHGYLVPLFALYLLWSRMPEDATLAPQPSWWGIPFLALGAAIHYAGANTVFGSDFLQQLAILFFTAGVFVLWSGPRALRWTWAGIVFLLFMIPLPPRVAGGLAQPLQALATRTSTYALQTLGFSAFFEGNIIRMGEVRIGVVEACSGLSMLVIFIALAAAVALVIRRPLFDRLLILFSAIPIAVLANNIRITVTGILHKTVNDKVADMVFHDLAGWLMMPLALGILWLELKALSWILVDHKEEGPELHLSGMGDKAGRSAGRPNASEPPSPHVQPANAGPG